MYDVTPDEDFILDRTRWAGVIIGSGFSGHGFKFGVLIGELLAALALGEAPAYSAGPLPPESLRTLAAGDTVVSRVRYAWDRGNVDG